MVQPLVSVVIPAYNSGEQIRKTIQSVLKQTYPRVEIIVVDDASTDRTWQLLQEYQSSVRLLRNEVNQGISVTRNKAITAAQGDYIALLDHDDLWDPQKLSRQMRLFEQNPALGLVFSDMYCTEEDGGRTWRYFQIYTPHRGPAFHELIRDNFVPCSTILFPKRVVEELGPFDKEFVCGEEYELCVRIASRYAMDYVEEPLATYLIHGGNYSNDIRNGLERIKFLRRYPAEPRLLGEIAVRYLFLSWLCLKRNLYLQACRRFVQGLYYMLRRPFESMRALSDFLRIKRHQSSQWTKLFPRS